MKTFILKTGAWSHGLSILLASTLLYLGVIASPQGWLAFPTVLLTLAGGLMPMLMTIVFIKMDWFDDNLTLKRFFSDKFSLSKPSFKGWTWVVAILLMGALVPVFIHWMMHGDIRLFKGGPLLFLPIGFFIGGLEEVGWRGFFLEKLEKRHTPFTASLFVGVIWMLWHWPLFFITGTYQQGLGLFTAEGIVFHLSILFGTFLYTFLYHKTRYSVLAVMIYHGTGNVLGEILIDAEPWVGLGVTVVLSLAIIAFDKDMFFHGQRKKERTAIRRPHP